MKDTKNGNSNLLNWVGIALMALGVIVAVYAVYTMLTFSPFMGGNFTGPGGFNQSGFNHSVSRTYGGSYGAGGRFMRVGFASSPETIVVGILLILLGFTVFKYAALLRQHGK